MVLPTTHPCACMLITGSFTDTSTMNRFIYLFVLFSGLILVSSLLGCQPKMSILLEGNPCQVPCWHNIRPGITSGEEFVQIASKLPFIDFPPTDVPRKYENAFSYSGWIFKPNFREESADVGFENNKVVYINFRIKDYFKVADLFEIYGKPEYFAVVPGGAEMSTLEIVWIYPEKGVIFSYGKFGGWPREKSVNISPDLPISQVYYFDPGALDKILNNYIVSYKIKESVKPWIDFGVVAIPEE
jgi:hypothetical protein